MSHTIRRFALKTSEWEGIPVVPGVEKVTLPSYSYVVCGMGEKLFAFWSIGNLGTWENNTHLQSFNQFTAL